MNIKISLFIMTMAVSLKAIALPAGFSEKDKNLSVLDKAVLVNNHYNQFSFDLEPGESDVWKTPAEFSRDKSGDSEDFVISKFFALSELGVKRSHMKLAYVNMQSFNDPHMVLFVFDSKSDKRYVLDNLDSEVKEYKERMDLSLIYSFDDKYIWTNDGFSGEAKQIPKWVDLLRKVE
ncbi:MULTISPECIES: transglutaminase-like cysteine peptidase [Vibrio]|uniref:transglutaminase-like cysteine peptidase n=1 Tax=Vibrio TaxID=662 RepID=UPI0029651334|nr:transglutaminase-like cysteine peptidase [Vibrio sp. Vb0587]MDW1965769.1 transglutaminase-like cysteine peptidase [Vibrio sp. Vb0587]